MMRNTKLSRRLLSLLLCLCLILPYIPNWAAADVQTEFGRVADPSTMDDWQQFFYEGLDNFDTANAGGIWTDKSVLLNNDEFEAMGITGIGDPSDRGFLSALSVMGSNMVITGEAAVATDTVLVLDISNSMTPSAVNAMVAATNTSIKTLMDANPNNRVAIVFYGSSASTFLGLDHYTTGSDDVYLISNNGNSISLDNEVRNSSNRLPSTSTTSIDGATYMAMGLSRAWQILDNATLDQTNTPRRPVIMLMTDGVPTYASSNFTNPTTSNRNLGTGNSGGTQPQDVFATELTASYVKEMATAKYGSAYKCLFYTLGMGVSSLSNVYKECVLNPTASNTQAITDFWNDYTAAANGTQIILEEADYWWEDDITLTKLASPALRADYVDSYYAAATADDLENAFQKVMTDIALQTMYHPTLVSSGDAQHDGYVSFVDKLGRYMEVAKINGLIIDNQLYTGSHMAHAFMNGELGTVAQPTTLGDNLIWSIKERLGVDADTARGLIASAYQDNQLYWTSDNDFSNYFGWYSDANNTFLGFCGSDTTAPAGTKYTNKSYLFLGALDETTRVRDMEMMYSTVRVREDIDTGEQEVNFALPASLVPTTTYTVDLDAAGELKSLTATAASPIRLVYESALDSRINKWTAGEILDNKYTSYVSPKGNSDTVNADGSINFFESKYDFDGDTGYGQYNTYAYYRPSHENDRFYFQYDKTLYLKAGESYVPYTGQQPAAGDGNTYYYGTTVYDRNGTALTKRTDYLLLNENMLLAVKQNTADGTWYMPYGYVREDFVGVKYAKEGNPPNPTDTLDSYAVPFNDFATGAGNANFTKPDHYLVVGTTLGNNGKLTLDAENGVKLTKLLEPGVTADPGKTFTFTLETTNTGLTNVPVYKLDASGAEVTAPELAFSGGTATVELKAGETIYIGGMAEGDSIQVTETEDIRYALKTITVDGEVQAVTAPTVTLDVVDMHNIAFTNGLRATGAVNVTKQVIHPYAASYTLPSGLVFPITLKLTFNEQALAEYELADGITTLADGTVSFDLAHNGSKLISGIPVGTKVQVTEAAPTGFTPTYGETSDVVNDGIVTVQTTTTTVAIGNNYQPTPADGSDIQVKGTKQYTGDNRTWAEGDSYTFTLQKRISGVWTDMMSQTLTPKSTDLNTNNVIDFAFTGAFANEIYTQPGTYYYRVVETVGTLAGVSYDNRLHGVEVVVEDTQMDGSLNITAIRIPDHSTATMSVSERTITASFLNSYNASEAVVNVNIAKKVENPTGSPNITLEGFPFLIAPVADFGQEVDWASATVIGATNSAGTLNYQLRFTDEGTYYYKLREADPTTAQANAGWTFDTAVRNLVVEVENNTSIGAYVAKVYLEGEGDGATSVLNIPITNRYAPEGEEIVIIDTNPGVARTDFVRKNTTGRPMEAGEFTFVILDANGVPYTTGTNEAAAAGEYAEVNFGKNLSFDTVGQFHFSVYEQDTAKPGVTKDDSIYTFTVVVTDNGQGNLEAVLTVDNGIDGNNLAEFTNTYTAQSVPFALAGTKVLNGKALTNNAFSFSVQPCDAMGENPGTAKPAYNLADGTILFPEETYNTPGTYCYLISEVIPSGETLGIQYDTAKFLATVTVSDDYTGQLKASAAYQKWNGSTSNWDAPAPMVFTNTYSAAPVNVTFEGTKVMDGKDLAAGDYSFQLYSSNAAWDLGAAIGQPVTNGEATEGAAPFAFPAREFTAAGTYHYLVKEVIPTEGEKGVAYDETVYRITVVITDNGRGNLESAVSVRTAGGVPTDDLRFTNVYAPVEGTSVTFNGHKDLTKGAGTDASFTDFTFTFEFYQSDSTFATVVGEKETMDAAEDGSFSFTEDFAASQLGQTLYYVIREKDNGTGGITYSTAEYRITVQVVDEVKDGVVETEVTITDKLDAPVTKEILDFVNDYSLTGGTSFSVNGIKAFTGRDIVDGEFKFDLYPANAQGDPTASVPVKSGYNTGYTFAINDVALLSAGTHYFLLKEDSTEAVAKPGVSYDPAKYLVTVVVTDNLDGTLTAAAPAYAKLGGGVVDVPSFSNSYQAHASDPLGFSGKKVLEGRDLIDGEFTFKMTVTDAAFQPLPGMPVFTAVNDVDGSFTFDSTIYSSEGVFHYIITEDSTDARERVEYDDTVYYVTVTVTDNTVTGKLETAYTIQKAPDAQKKDETIVFTNIFTPKPTDLTVDFGVDKTVENKGSEKITAEGFQFLLEQVGTDKKLTVKTDAEGKARFSLVFTEDDIGSSFSFKLSEVKGDLDHVTYSDAVYNISLTLSLGDDNKLVAAITQDGKPVDAVTAAFVNVYDYTPPVTPTTGDFFSLPFWLSLIFISFGGLVGTVAYGKKKEEAVE